MKVLRKRAQWLQGFSSLLKRRGAAGLLTLALFIIAGIYLFVNARKLAEFEWQLRLGWLLLAIISVIVIGPLTRVWLWQFVLKRLGIVISFSECFRIVRLSQLAKYLPGKVWHYVGTFYLTHKAGATKKVSLSSMLYDHGSSFVAGALVVCFCTLLIPSCRGQTAIWVVSGVNLLIGIVFVQPTLFSKIMNLMLRIFKRLPIPFLQTVSTDLPALGTGVIVMLILLNVGFWVILGSALYFMVRGVAYPGIPLIDAVMTAAVGVMAGFITPIVPSGIGVTEGIFVLLMRRYFPLEICLAISLLFRVLNVSKEIILGLVAVKIEHRNAANREVSPIATPSPSRVEGV